MHHISSIHIYLAITTADLYCRWYVMMMRSSMACPIQDTRYKKFISQSNDMYIIMYKCIAEYYYDYNGNGRSTISPVHIGLQMGEPTTNCNRIDFFTICSKYVPHITYKKSNWIQGVEDYLICINPRWPPNGTENILLAVYSLSEHIGTWFKYLNIYFMGRGRW